MCISKLRALTLGGMRQGCLLSCSHSSRSQEVSSFCLPRSILRIFHSSIQPVPRLPDFHKMHESSPYITMPKGFKNPPLFGRLAYLCPLVPGGRGSDGGCSGSRRGTRHIGDLRKELLASDTANHLYWAVPGNAGTPT